MATGPNPADGLSRNDLLKGSQKPLTMSFHWTKGSPVNAIKAGVTTETVCTCTRFV